MSVENLQMWRFTPSSDDPCHFCESMAGTYSYEVVGPHPGCRCAIVEDGVAAELIASREELVETYQLVLPVTTVPRGGETAIAKTWNTDSTSTVSQEATGTEGFLGVTFGSSQADTDSVGGSETVTFRYDDETGGGTQTVNATYDVSIYWTIETHRHNYPGGYLDYEVVANTREVRTFSGYVRYSL